MASDIDDDNEISRAMIARLLNQLQPEGGASTDVAHATHRPTSPGMQDNSSLHTVPAVQDIDVQTESPAIEGLGTDGPATDIQAAELEEPNTLTSATVETTPGAEKPQSTGIPGILPCASGREHDPQVTDSEVVAPRGQTTEVMAGSVDHGLDATEPTVVDSDDRGPDAAEPAMADHVVLGPHPPAPVLSESAKHRPQMLEAGLDSVKGMKREAESPPPDEHGRAAKAVRVESPKAMRPEQDSERMYVLPHVVPFGPVDRMCIELKEVIDISSDSERETTPPWVQRRESSRLVFEELPCF